MTKHESETFRMTLKKEPRQMNLWDTDMIRSNGSRKLGSRPANPMTQLFVFVASCLSNQFALPGTLLRQSR